MPLLTIVFTLAMVGLIVYLITKYIPMPEPFRNVIYVVCVVGLILWLMQITGFVGPTIRLGRLP